MEELEGVEGADFKVSIRIQAFCGGDVLKGSYSRGLMRGKRRSTGLLLLDFY